MNILLTAILLCNVVLLAVILVAGARIRREYRRISQEVNQFILPVDEKTPSPAAQVADQISSMFARALVAQAKASFMGKQSGEARGQAAIEGDIALDMAGQASPLIGGLLNSFPALKKTLRRNPQLLDFALSKLAGSGQGSAPVTPAAPGSNGHHQTTFKL